MGRNGKRLPGRSLCQNSELLLGVGDHVSSQPPSCLRNGSGRKSGQLPLCAVGMGSGRRRPSAATERGRTDTCWPLPVTAGKVPAFYPRPCSPLPKAPSIADKFGWARAQESRTPILYCTVMLQKSFERTHFFMFTPSRSGALSNEVTPGRAQQASEPTTGTHPGLAKPTLPADQPGVDPAWKLSCEQLLQRER